MKLEHVLKLKNMMHKAAASLTDTDAFEAVELFPAWHPDTAYTVDERIRYGEKLYRVVQGHTSQSDWTPNITPALYAEVEKPGQGDTPDDPIHYDNNMELLEGKYYEQKGVVYICFRSTGVPVYNDLADLVGLYVNVYE